MNDSAPVADIVIVGASLVGAPLALVLASQGWQVVLLDAETGEIAPVPSGAELEMAEQWDDASALQQRCTALSLGTQRWFDRHGLWSAIAGDAAPIFQVSVSHKGYFGATRLHAHELNADAVGYVVNNTHLANGILARLATTTVDHRRGARVVSVAHHQDHVEVAVADGSSVRARLLIAADGVGSVVRESLGIGTTQVDYDQAAVLTMVRLAQHHQNVAYERFTDSGPLALLPRTGSCMNVVDCIEPSEQAAVGELDDAAYLARLQSRFGFRAGRFTEVGPRLIVPLVRIEATSQVAARTVLLGNSARLLHPVGGQGYNLAMRDVEELAERLVNKITGHKQASSDADPGDAQLLSEFVAARQSDQRQVVRFTDTLARSFRGHSAVAGHIRSAALLGLDAITPLRKTFARRTMGLGR
ncbi:FAD-dependent monooxygenase [Granulosicoccus antarcticus]|uniref:2-octaprenyl-6-methoxyphenol hydroxylase n=1 Tax=Granulosicoccus antarcticus IMCC3135 TaxID=1192854 RepID=A0A2Z2NZV1_9GAMM|nr:FAD-dependent monooxygenase [Granulosicoccus antarcticus]ASJ75975.1 2-octaprenyl-6-methoxyphenol hydroxylase [Granulosicoccus antarcticus IMCC3135]